MSNETSSKGKSNSIHSKLMGLKLKSGGSLIHIKTDCPDKYTKEYKHYYEYKQSGKRIVKIRVYVDEEKIVVFRNSSGVVNGSTEVFSDIEKAVTNIESFLNSI